MKLTPEQLVQMEKPHTPGKFEECNNCKKKTRKTCHRCKITKYCSPKCQKEAWEVHKDGCNVPDKSDSEDSSATDSVVGGLRERINGLFALEDGIRTMAHGALQATLEEFAETTFGRNGALYKFIGSLLYGWRKQEYPLICTVNIDTKISRFEVALPSTKWYQTVRAIPRILTQDDPTQFNEVFYLITSTTVASAKKVNKPLECLTKYSVKDRTVDDISIPLGEELLVAIKAKKCIDVKLDGTWSTVETKYTFTSPVRGATSHKGAKHV